MVRIIILFLLAFSIVACGGGGGSSSADNSSTPVSSPQNNLPIFTSVNNIEVLEGQVSVLEITVNDEDGDSLSLTITGSDANQFSLSGNTLNFYSVPDYEAPGSSAGTNSYSITLNANDGSGTTTQAVTINVLDATEGRVVDGPISGARVFLDLDGDLIQDPNEISVVTDANGYFKLPANPEAKTQHYKLVAVGGTDTSTGITLPNMVLVSNVPAAEEASVIVTPVSTLIAAANSPSEQQAVLTSLGITGTVDEILTLDSWAQAQMGNQQAIAIQTANQAIGIVFQSTASIIANEVGPIDNAMNLVMAISDQLVAQSVTGANLFDVAVLAKVLEQGMGNFDSNKSDSFLNLYDPIAGSLTDTISILAAAENPTSNLVNDILATAQGTLQTEITAVARVVDINLFLDNTDPFSLFSDADPEMLDSIDADGDGVSDRADAFPFDTNEWLDTDNDGIGNNADTDIDGDDISNIADAFPLDANEYRDLDNDGIGDNADRDIDGDGVSNLADAYPRISLDGRVDTDVDGIPDNCSIECLELGMLADNDDDDDGWLDSMDAFPLDTHRARYFKWDESSWGLTSWFSSPGDIIWDYTTWSE